MDLYFSWHFSDCQNFEILGSVYAGKKLDHARVDPAGKRDRERWTVPLDQASELRRRHSGNCRDHSAGKEFHHVRCHHGFLFIGALVADPHRRGSAASLYRLCCQNEIEAAFHPLGIFPRATLARTLIFRKIKASQKRDPDGCFYIISDGGMMKKLLLALVILIASFSFAEQQTYQISPSRSSLIFDGNAQVHHVHGKSRAFSGTVTGDPSDMSTAKIDVKLDPQTFDTNNKDRDKVMREKSLEIDKYPSIDFISNSVEASEKQLQPGKPVKATIHGTLKLHGVEKEMAIPVTISRSENELTADGDLALRLDDWSIFRPKVLFFQLQNDITIHFQIVAIRPGSAAQ